MTFAYKSYRSVYLFSLLLAFLCVTARAEYNPVKLGEAIGAYLASVGTVKSFNESECSYINTTSPTMKEAVQDVIKHLTPSDAVPLLEYISSPDYIKELQENDEFVNGFLMAGKSTIRDRPRFQSGKRGTYCFEEK